MLRLGAFEIRTPAPVRFSGRAIVFDIISLHRFTYVHRQFLSFLDLSAGRPPHRGFEKRAVLRGSEIFLAEFATVLAGTKPQN